ncbi:esterase-like activity of phytase family protein [Muricoccus aerilatus]|uniref:esterase-like activity of phytase family protein n=1 Tax=Muricoccus aerilatus TaxID=452982 RepID=UPI0005C25F83|nr:esterase-like activity of phytase family protein [Roseomonas aerilata]
MRLISLHTALLALGGLACATSAGAAPLLLATGTLTGSAAGANADLSGLTGTLENGLPANILGGTGSGIAYAGGNTFIAVPDRGPNATPYASGVDDTVSYVPRFNTITMNLAPATSGSLPFALTPTLQSTTLLSSRTPLAYGTGAGIATNSGAPLGSGVPAGNTPTVNYFSGRSDNFDPAVPNSGNPNNARLDPEGVRVSNDGRSVFVSDEYGPYVYQFDRQTGERIRSYALPANLDVSNLSPVGQTEIDGNPVGRVANKGMEGLAITPDGKTLVGIMQAGLEQDTASPKLLRIVTVDVATGATHEYGYLLHGGSGVSEIVAINDHQFLVDERDGKGLGDNSNAKVKTAYEIDLAGAQDITGLTGNAAAALAVPSRQVADFVSLLSSQLGLTPAQIPSKIEGFAFGSDVSYNGSTLHTLYVANDNDFLPGSSGPNTFYVFGPTDADLFGNFVQQGFTAVPEPASLGLFGIGLATLLTTRRRQRREG